MIISILLILEFKANYNHLNLNNYFEIGILTLRRIIRKKKIFIIIIIFIAIKLLIINYKEITQL